MEVGERWVHCSAVGRRRHRPLHRLTELALTMPLLPLSPLLAWRARLQSVQTFGRKVGGHALNASLAVLDMVQ